MTAIRTLFEAGYYAVTASSTRYIILDRFQNINVAVLDDFAALFSALRIKKINHLPLDSLINACVVFALAKEIGLQPGLFAEGDTAILTHCRFRISRNIMVEDHEMLIQELINGWQTIATNPLVKKYVQLGEYLCAEGNRYACTFSPVGGFGLFIQDYFTGCMRAFMQDAPDELPLMMQFCNVLHGNALGVGFHHNQFFCRELFLQQTSGILAEMGEHRAKLEQFIAQEKKRYEAFRVCCFTTIVGWTKIELMDIEEFPEAANAIEDLLQRKALISGDHELRFQLADLNQQLTITSAKENRLIDSCHFAGTQWTLKQQHALVCEAIHYAVIDYAKEYVFKPQRARPLKGLPLYYLAGQGVESEAILLEKLFDEAQAATLKPFEWYAILQNAKGEILIEFLQQMIAKRSSDEEIAETINSLSHFLPSLSLPTSSSLPTNSRLMTSSSLPTSSSLMSSSLLIRRAPTQHPLLCRPMQMVEPITHQYRRLSQMVKGSPPKSKMGSFMLPPSHAASSTSTEVNELADTLNETLNLQERSDCLLM